MTMNLPVLLKRIFFYSAMAFGLYNLTTLTIDIYSLSQKEAEKNQKIESLETEKKRLNDKLVFINSDDFVEKEARTKLNMKKENEQIFVVNTGTNNVSREESSEAPKSKKSVFSRWMEVIF